ncbi:hypothetical protein CAL29_01260 [Bordetella genomosp. 10]|uniref:Uncharacterized protein n=1 Tax=Bordetella genomosp. 10 TaxID=1416804 RepID=A0A261SJH7_9BORD|nr:hypothetical protein [Bordetella genomosp. 10]OZI37092.1 hypothetical protein CAL29_01260 [Bordetella genomosp. 10]
MKRIVVGLIFSFLMFFVALCFFGAARGNDTLHFPGIGIEPAELGKLLLLAALLILPFWLTLQIDARRRTRLTRYAILASLAVLAFFPLPFQGELRHPATNRDGTPMIDQTFNDGRRVQAFDGLFGYAPFWNSYYVRPARHPDYDRRNNETRDLQEGNAFWGKRTSYRLYPDNEKDDRECREAVAWHLLGFYYDDRKDRRMPFEMSPKTDPLCRPVQVPEGLVRRDRPVIGIPALPGG